MTSVTYSTRSTYSSQIQLQACNLILLLLGLLAAGLAGSQFSAVALDNYRLIDLRLLNFFHAITGAVGFYCVAKNHGSIVVKSLLSISFCIGVATAIFYGFTTYRIVDSYNRLIQLQDVSGFQQEFGTHAENYVGKIVISSVSIGMSALAGLVSLIGIILLDRLVIVESSWTVTTREQELEFKHNSSQLTSVGLVKLFLALCTLGLAAFLEYLHELLGGRQDYIKIALDHIAAFFAIVSAITDLQAVYGKKRTVLNLKVSLGLSVVAATWCLKAVDNGMYPYYKEDIRVYRQVEAAPIPSASYNSNEYIIIICHGVLLSALAILFMLSAFTAILSGCCLKRESYHNTRQLTKEAVMQSRYITIKILKSKARTLRFLGIVHVFWATCSMALVLLGLCQLPWNGDYIGGDMLWLAVLYFTTGVFGSTNMNVLVTTKFVFNVISLGLSVEKTCVAINLIYQSVTYPDYANEQVMPKNIFIGQIVLNSCQCLVLFGEVITSLIGAVIFGRHLTSVPYYIHNKVHSSAIHVVFSIGTLLYGIVMTGCYVVFELGKWRYNEVPIEVPFFRLSNGPFALAVFVVQFLCGIYQSAILLPVTVLQIIISSLALFVLNSAMTNVYYIKVLIENEDFISSTRDQHTILIVALVLAATAVLTCILAIICGVISILRSSYIMHRRSPGSDMAAVVTLDDAYGLPSTLTSSPRPFVPTTFQPMEEQTLYWSAEENPYVYKSTKRYYGQPYVVDAGYYGYPGVYNGPRRASMDDAIESNRSVRVADVTNDRIPTSTIQNSLPRAK
ncbi:hypothetical protein M3Y94_00812700 [Aphelenchoides besseyi]|nr:hypothetical protein M3Y94_00812700 [Aphelenchoides besseyi]KAI6227192.1 hypothetical protein M3Y95_00700800 [Aphelenchoides besseyi]